MRCCCHRIAFPGFNQMLDLQFKSDHLAVSQDVFSFHANKKIFNLATLMAKQGINDGGIEGLKKYC